MARAAVRTPADRRGRRQLAIRANEGDGFERRVRGGRRTSHQRQTGTRPTRSEQGMNWILPVRTIGVIAGLLLIGLGAAWLLSGISDPPTQNLGDFVLVGGSLLVPGALMAAPWSRIRSLSLWYSLFIALVLVVPAAAAPILAVNTWSAIHGAGGPGFALVGLLVVAWATQLPSIWSLRPTRK